MKKIVFLSMLACLLFSARQIGDDADPKIDYEQALFTGPLLAPSAHTVPAGHVDIEPYFYANFNTGVYNDHWEFGKPTGLGKSFEIQPLIQIGVFSFMDFDLSPYWKYNVAGRYEQSGMGDLNVKFGFQLLRQGPNPFSLKFSLAETFPTAKFERLDIGRQGVDSFGSGAFVTSFGLASGWNHKIEPGREFRTRFAITYSIPSRIHVHGMNSYGGDVSTNGYVTNDGILDVVCGLEYSLTRQWALALDIDSLYQCPTKFEGSTIKSVGKDSSTYVLSLAPAIEFNLNTTYGFIGGVWFSVFGFDHTAFVNGVFAFNIYI